MGSEMCIRDRFRGRPLIRGWWATTKQACRDELVVYLFFLPYIVRNLVPRVSLERGRDPGNEVDIVRSTSMY